MANDKKVYRVYVGLHTEMPSPNKPTEIEHPGYRRNGPVPINSKKCHRRCKKLRRLVDEGRADIELLKTALKAIIDHAEVHGFWNTEQKLAETALDQLTSVEAERVKAEKKRRGEL